jgi:tRNA(Ile)-lysidine synthase
VLHRLRDELGVELVVAHFNHGLRPQEDEAERAFVRGLADSFGLSLETGRADPESYGGSSLEEQARRARYDFLNSVRQRVRAQKIAVGHSLNDQAETVLMRLLRGSGPRGLAGIPPHRRPGIIRPLLEVPRSQIQTYVKERGLGWVTDSSNQEIHYLRNRIRRKLIPLLEEYQPRVVEILARTGEVLRRDEEWLEEEAREWLGNQAVEEGAAPFRIPVQPFLHLPAALQCRVLRLAVLALGENSLRGISFRHLESIAAMAGGMRPQSQLTLPHGIRVCRVYDQLVFSKEKGPTHPSYRYVLQQPGTYRLDAVGLTLCLEETAGVETGEIGRDPGTAHLDAERLDYPLAVRNVKAGDRFVPLGMKGTQKIKDFFMDRKIPTAVRHRVPILTHRDKPVWICGMRMDDRYKVTQDTRRVLRASIRGAIE